MSKMQGAVVDPSAPGRVAVHEVETPTPVVNEALVRVAVTSMTPGEVDYSQSGIPGRPLGCDVTGTIEQAAADGSGPEVGARVVGRVTSGAWAELVAVPTDVLAELPNNVSFEQAATLATSGLTALYVLEKGDRLLGHNVLITGANGSVGLFACQIAKLMGAKVVAQIRHEHYRSLVTKSGADCVVIGEDAVDADEFGPYKLVAESVGGVALANCMNQLAPDGICVSFGNMSQSETTFNAWSFMVQPRARLYGFIISNEFALAPASDGLSRLAQLVSDGMLKTRIGMEEPVDKISEVAKELSEHKIEGKAVIRMWI